MRHVDKNSIKHFLVTFATSLIFGIFGAGIAVGASITKEYCDNNYKFPWEQSSGHWCWADLMFDTIGIVVGLTINKLIL